MEFHGIMKLRLMEFHGKFHGLPWNSDGIWWNSVLTGPSIFHIALFLASSSSIWFCLVRS
jgi:hypothetical protein